MTTETNKPVANPGGAEETRSESFYRPSVDIVERPDELLLFADLPGVTPESLEIDFRDGQLTISGRVARRQPADTRYLAEEYGVGDFHRVFTVSELIDASQISAEYAQGVLALHLPKQVAAQPRKITVKVKG